MIYCIGDLERFERGLDYFGRNSLQLCKNARVWQTEKDALAYIKEKGLTGYAVYGLKAKWDEDTEAVEDGPRRLKICAYIKSLWD